MEVYNTEEEQVQAIKKWWKENAFSLIAGIVMGSAILVAYKYWTETNENQSQQASVIYNQVATSDSDKTKNTEILKTDFSGTPYAALAALLLAKDNVTANEIEKAVSQLKWVVENNNDSGIQHIAQQRLARLYLSQNNIESAEAIIKDVKADGFSSIYNEIRGDINLAKNLPTQAKKYYRLALAALPQGDKRYATVKMKLDDLPQAGKIIKANGNNADEVKEK